MKRTIEQLRSKMWKTHQEAKKELEANGYPVPGIDYELVCSGPEKWFVKDKDFDMAPKKLDPPTITPAKPKPAETAPAAMVGGGAAAASERKAAAKAPPPIAPARKGADPKPKTSAEVVALPARVAQGGGSPQRKAPAKEARPKTNGEAGPVKTDAERPADAPDLSPVPSVKGKPFVLVIEGEGVLQGEEQIVTQAMEVARRTGLPVGVYAGGQLQRRFDAKNIVRARSSGGSPRVPGQPRTGAGKSVKCAELLMRNQGATKAQLMEVTVWSFGDKYIRLIAKANKCEIEALGDQHWRLVPGKS